MSISHKAVCKTFDYCPIRIIAMLFSMVIKNSHCSILHFSYTTQVGPNGITINNLEIYLLGHQSSSPTNSFAICLSFFPNVFLSWQRSEPIHFWMWPTQCSFWISKLPYGFAWFIWVCDLLLSFWCTVFSFSVEIDSRAALLHSTPWMAMNHYS